MQSEIIKDTEDVITKRDKKRPKSRSFSVKNSLSGSSTSRKFVAATYSARTRKRIFAKRSIMSAYLASPSAKKRTSTKSYVAAKSLKKKTVSSKKTAAASLGEDRVKAPQKIQQKSSENINFMLLPTEIKLIVFKNLSPQDLMAVSATCYELNFLIQDPSLWTALTVDISESRRSLIWKVEKCPWLHTLKITNKNRLNLWDKQGRFKQDYLNKIGNIVRRAPRFKNLVWDV